MAATRLIFLPYLQSGDTNELQLRLLLIPRGSPLDSLTTNAPNFPNAHFKFDVHLQQGLDNLPTPGSSGSLLVTVDSPPISTALPIYTGLAKQFQIDPNPPTGNTRLTGTQVKKHLPLTYQHAVNYTPGANDLVFTDCTYSCLFKASGTPFKPLPAPNPKIAWGKVIAFILRNSALAEAAGLVRTFKLSIIPPVTLKSGGFIYITLNPASDASGLLTITGGLKIYAGRIPAITGPRTLFSPVLFPVVSPPSPLNYDDIFAEVDNYDDGWAKAVHCIQPQQLDPLQETPDGTRPIKELGIRIGWDDEQVTIWMNRQLDGSKPDFDSPFGVQGYRVDVRISKTTNWSSLVRATGPLIVPGVSLPTFNGELSVEIHPIQLQAQKTGDFWLPTYFTAWHGPSLASLDTTLIKLTGGPDKTGANVVKGVPPSVPLTYGKSYDFRVRFMDHTGGGPDVSGNIFNPGPNPIATINFCRWIRPYAPNVVNPPPPTPDPTNPPATLKFTRPLMHYPAVVCTGFYADPIASLIADMPAAHAENREVGLPDPDVDRVQITIEVAIPPQDPTATDGTYTPVLTTTRPFPSDPTQPLVLDIKWTDIENVYKLDTVEPGTGPLLLPTARDVLIRVGALCKDDNNLKYFGASDVRTGPTRQILLRKDSSNETDLFANDLATNRFSAFYFQPDLPIDPIQLIALRTAGKTSPPNLASRAAGAFSLRNDDLTFRTLQPGRRIVFGCTAAIRHVIGPDGASITFSSQADLALHWIVVLKLKLARDWSWDGLAYDGLVVVRDGAEVGRFAPTRNINSDAIASGTDRTETDLVFFDAIEAKPPSGTFPQELNPVYTVTSTFKGSPTVDAPIKLTIRLPVTTPPTQVPQIVSAGLAMSPYHRATDYSSTDVRQKVLWIELAAGSIDPRNRFFARVLRNAPDPLLSTLGESVANTDEPALAIDPEPVRHILQGQATDQSGLNAMQQLIPSDSPLHWALPLPPGLDATSPELFGFFTYELRVGHVEMWSTAQGRFGPPLRVAGVQHPPPPLTITVLRNKTSISCSLPFALPVLDGVPYQPKPPRSTMWILLYAQAEQIDGLDRRNILLTRQAARFIRIRIPVVTGAFGEASFSTENVDTLMTSLGFPTTSPLSVLAVELLPQFTPPTDPLGVDLGGQRILRTSALTPVPAICC